METARAETNDVNDYDTDNSTTMIRPMMTMTAARFQQLGREQRS
jgi:hypothetical protein